MLNIRYILILLAVSIFLIKCQTDSELPDFEKKLVVDGWIENGALPKVILTFSSEYFTEVDSFSALNYLASTAKVSVISSDVSEILAYKTSDVYFPPRLYSALQMEGVVGKTYQLEITLKNKTYRAQATIPNPPQVDSVWMEKLQCSDTLGIIRIIINDPAGKGNCYRILTQIKHKNKRFIPTRIANYSDELFDGQKIELPLYRGNESNVYRGDTAYFDIRDTIAVKVCSMNLEAYEYWSSVEQQIRNAGNPLISQGKKIPTNIEGGGIGFWCAFGTYKKILMPIVLKKR
jgi:hypothetical protein